MAALSLQGMSDQKYIEISDEVPEIQFLIVISGGMATKTRVEEVLMARHGLNRSDAHTFVNLAEGKIDFAIRSGRAVWLADRPPPTTDKYSEVMK